jgi:hypothetical protein
MDADQSAGLVVEAEFEPEHMAMPTHPRVWSESLLVPIALGAQPSIEFSSDGVVLQSSRIHCIAVAVPTPKA